MQVFSYCTAREFDSPHHSYGKTFGEERTVRMEDPGDEQQVIAAVKRGDARATDAFAALRVSASLIFPAL